MTSSEIRRSFLEFFAERGHRVLPSSPLVLPNDPTLLFANAGMNQFKDVFTGADTREYVRAATSQKCLRVSGKHNDLEQVGRTPRHHTFFEMLGNFSFGDYFKEDAVAWAWELVTRVWGVPEDRLWVTVFGGTEAVPADEEAYAIWRDRAKVRPERILRLGEKDNFWRMGDTGPCGPCSEIHYDLGADLTSVEGPANPETDSRRFIEIWNLVFMQFEQRADGALAPLPAPSIDTGMGLERITSVLQGKRSNYDTDLFVPILRAAAERAGTPYGADADKDVSMRVIADHVRALTFLVADGIVPANDGRGYVLRRVLRRAIRHGIRLGITEPFVHDLLPSVVGTLGEVYPEIVAPGHRGRGGLGARRSGSARPSRSGSSSSRTRGATRSRPLMRPGTARCPATPCSSSTTPTGSRSTWRRTSPRNGSSGSTSTATPAGSRSSGSRRGRRGKGPRRTRPRAPGRISRAGSRSRSRGIAPLASTACASSPCSMPRGRRWRD